MNDKKTYELFFKNIHKIFFLGLSGVSMSALAVLSHKNQYEIAGCDLIPENFIHPKIKNYKQNIDSNYITSDIDMAVYNSYISEESSDITKLKKLNIPLIHRSKYLDIITSKFSKLCVSGLVGKTSSSFFITTLCDCMGLDVNAMVGAKVFNNDSDTYKFTNSDHIILELNEGDMHEYVEHSDTLLLTNALEDKHDHFWNFKNKEHFIEQYKKLVNQATTIIYNNDYPLLCSICKDHPNTISYGQNQDSNVQINSINNNICQFTYGDKIYSFKNANIMGNFSFINIVGAIISIHKHFNIDVKKILLHCDILEHPNRRMKIVYKDSTRTIITDQGCHPFKLRHGIEGLVKKYPNRKISIFHNPGFNKNKYVFKDEIYDIMKKYNSFTNSDFWLDKNNIRYISTDEQMNNFLDNSDGIVYCNYVNTNPFAMVLDKWLIKNKNNNTVL